MFNLLVDFVTKIILAPERNLLKKISESVFDDSPGRLPPTINNDPPIIAAIDAASGKARKRPANANPDETYDEHQDSGNIHDEYQEMLDEMKNTPDEYYRDPYASDDDQPDPSIHD